MKKLILISLAIVILDQLSKFYFGKTKNYGAAFGILQGYNWLFIIIALSVIFAVLYYYKEFKSYGKYGVIFLFSGSIGNLVDRLFLGYVRDFIELGFWPSFNIADSFNVIGVVMLIVYFWREKK